MPAAIAVPLIVGAASAGASVAAAKMQSNAAKKAAEMQQGATNQALAAQRDANQPYMDLGRQSVNRLMQMPPQNYTQSFTGPGGSNGAQPFQLPPNGPPPGMPPQGNLASLGRPRTGAPTSGQAVPRGGQIGPQAGRMVQLQAPDGSIRPFPEQDVQAIIQRAQAKGHQLRVVG